MVLLDQLKGLLQHRHLYLGILKSLPCQRPQIALSGISSVLEVTNVPIVRLEVAQQ